MKLISSQQLGRGDRCVVTARTKDSEGFLLTGAVVKDSNGWDREVILSAAVVKEAARLLGWVSPDEVEKYIKSLDGMGAEIADLSEKINDLSTLKELEVKVAA